MVLADLLIALAVTVVVMLVLMVLFGWGRRDSRTLLIALAVFLAAWVGGLWLAPFGPSVSGSYWAPFLAAAVLFTLIWLAVAPWPVWGRQRRAPDTPPSEAPLTADALLVVGGFYWTLLAVLVALIVIAYVRA
jgi:hypothetical protein